MGPPMRIASRTARRQDTFDNRFDEMIAAILLADGFIESQPYVFTRGSAPGQDVIYFDVEAASIIVQAAFQPNYMREIDELYAPTLQPKESALFAFSYLTPVCMTHRPKVYSCKLAAHRDRSFAMVAQGLNTHALRWLMSLRDPLQYADAVPRTAMMYVGRANEWAGRKELAMAAYEEDFRRHLVLWKDFTFRAIVEGEGARGFIYLCKKLGREPEKCERVMNAIKFRPVVAPFGEG